MKKCRDMFPRLMLQCHPTIRGDLRRAVIEKYIWDKVTEKEKINAGSVQ